MVSLPARRDGKIWAFYSVSGEIPALERREFWGICVASVKFCSLACTCMLIIRWEVGGPLFNSRNHGALSAQPVPAQKLTERAASARDTAPLSAEAPSPSAAPPAIRPPLQRLTFACARCRGAVETWRQRYGRFFRRMSRCGSCSRSHTLRTRARSKGARVPLPPCAFLQLRWFVVLPGPHPDGGGYGGG